MQSADFFRADNPEGMEARNEVNIHQLNIVLKQMVIVLFSPEPKVISINGYIGVRVNKYFIQVYQ